MKKLGALFIIVFISAFAAAVIAKTIQTPQFSYTNRPIIDNLKPWKMYTSSTTGIQFSYPAYLTEVETRETEQDVYAVFAYAVPEQQDADYPIISIRSVKSDLSLQDWFEKEYGSINRCSEDEIGCFGVTAPTPVVINGKTALQFRRNEKRYQDTHTIISHKGVILTITNHSTPEGTIPDATYKEMLEKMVLKN